MIEKIDGIILAGMKFGDTSKIIRVFTKEHGKISFIVKGAYNKKNSYGATLEVLSYIGITYYPKSNGLNLLSKAEFIQYFTKTVNNNEKLLTALSMLELINITQPEKAINEELFELLLYSINKVNEADKESFHILVRFLISFISVSGFEVDFTLPIKEVHKYYFFSLNDGYFLNGNFSGKRFYRIEASSVKKIKLINDNIQDVILSRKEKNEILYFLLEYISFHFEKNIELNSLELLI